MERLAVLKVARGVPAQPGWPRIVFKVLGGATARIVLTIRLGAQPPGWAHPLLGTPPKPLARGVGCRVPRYPDVGRIREGDGGPRVLGDGSQDRDLLLEILGVGRVGWHRGDPEPEACDEGRHEVESRRVDEENPVSLCRAPPPELSRDPARPGPYLPDRLLGLATVVVQKYVLGLRRPLTMPRQKRYQLDQVANTALARRPRPGGLHCTLRDDPARPFPSLTRVSDTPPASLALVMNI